MFQFLRINTHFTVKLLLFMALAASSCTSEGSGNSGRTAGTTLAPASLTPVANTPKPTPTVTTSPTAIGVIQTLPPSPFPTPSIPARTATPTATPVPTLSVDEEGDFLSELMLENGGCELPCWWGIVPGQTAQQDARDWFASQGINEWEWGGTPEGSYYSIGLGHPVAGSPYGSRDVVLFAWVAAETIELVQVAGSRAQGEDSHNFTDDWTPFAPSNLLQRYGIPTRVELMKIMHPDPGPPYYQLTLSYPDLGIEAHYIILYETLEDGRDRLCSDFEDVQHIELFLHPPGRTSGFPIELLATRDLYDSWEATTGTDLEALRQLFDNAEESTCLEF